tara:strand:- start:206 stop:337 length:132 start_codon:yes stop_codon:yes gene_type:complete
MIFATILAKCIATGVFYNHHVFANTLILSPSGPSGGFARYERR